MVKYACLENQRSQVRPPIWHSDSEETNVFSLFTLKDSVLWEAYLVSDRQGSKFESCLCRVVSFHSPHYPQEVLLAQFSHTFILYTNR